MRTTRARIRSALLPLMALALAVGTPSCSSTPEVVEIVEVKNQAAEMSKLADGFAGKGQYDAALQYYQLSLESNASVDNMQGVAVAHNSIGRVFIAVRQFEAARLEFEQALDFAAMAGDKGVMALALTNLGELDLIAGDAEAAAEKFEKAIELASGDEKALAIALHNRGVIYKNKGMFDEAKADFLRAASINERLKRFTEYASNMFMLATVAVKLGDDAGAEAYLLKALEADKKAENSNGILSDLLALGQLNHRVGDLKEAYVYYKRAFGVILTTNDVALARKVLAILIELASALELPKDVDYWRMLQTKLPPG